MLPIYVCIEDIGFSLFMRFIWIMECYVLLKMLDIYKDICNFSRF